jgi:predicted nucleic acid-binding protein
MKKILLGIQTVLDGGKYIHYLTLKEIVRVLESIRVLIKEEDLKEFNEFVKKIEEEAERYEIKWR